MTTYSASVNSWNTSSSHRTVTQNVGTGDTINVSFGSYSPYTTVLVSLITNCSSSVAVNSGPLNGVTLTFSSSSAGTYDFRVTHVYSSGKTSTTKYSGVTGTVSAATPTLTAVDISPATWSNSGAGSQAFAATKTGTATDVVYAWSLTGDTDNATLSATSGTPVTVTMANDIGESQETVTVNVSATSSSASVSSGITDTAVITQTHDAASLTAVDISPATATISNGGTQAFTASITGNVTDTVYAWSLSGDTDNVSLSSSSGNPVTVTATDVDDTSQETVTVNVSATSSQASVSSGVTDTSTLTLNHTQTPQGVLVTPGGTAIAIASIANPAVLVTGSSTIPLSGLQDLDGALIASTSTGILSSVKSLNGAFVEFEVPVNSWDGGANWGSSF